VQVVRADHQRPGQCHLLGQVRERVDGAELQARVAGHGDRAPVPAVPYRQQLPDGRPPRIRRPPGTPEHPGHQPEWPGPFQLTRPARRHLHPAAARLLQHVLEQPRLADAGLTLDQHDGLAAGRQPVQGVVQDRAFRVAAAQARAQRPHSPDAIPAGPRSRREGIRQAAGITVSTADASRWPR
jgi:hypothetical protein